MPEKLTTGATLKRAQAANPKPIDGEDSRRFSLAVSSEHPVERMFGDEVLSHERSAIDMSFFGSGRAPLLVDHDSRDIIGVVETVSLDESERVLRAVVRFGRSARAQEIMADVQDGIRCNTSVQYRVHEWAELPKKSGYRITKWSPLEVSIVSIPADPTVGVGRSDAMQHTSGVKGMTPEEIAAERQRVAAEARAAAETEARTIRETAENEARTIAERAQAIADMRELAARRNLSTDLDTWLTAERRAMSPDAIRAQFRGFVIDKLGGEPIETPQNIGLGERELANFSVMRLIGGLLNGNQRGAEFEFEACEAAEAKAREVGARNVSGGNGVRIPAEVLRNWTMAPATGQRVLNTTDDSALVPTEHLASSFIGLLRKKAAVMRAGVTVLNGLSGNVDIPKQLTGSAAGWIATEHGDAPNTEPTFGTVSLSPKDIAAYIDVTRRMMQQSSPDIEALMRADIVEAMRYGLDLGVLLGTGSNGQPLGVRNQVGINKPTGWVGSVPTWQEVLAMVAAIEDDEALEGNLKWIGRTALRSSLMGTPKESGQPIYIMPDGSSTLAGYEYIASNKATAGELMFGNWSDVLVGFWSGLEITVDNSALALKGGKRIIAFQTADVAVRHAESFVYNAPATP